MASGMLTASNNGKDIMMVGLVIHILFFGFFVATAARFH